MAALFHASRRQTRKAGDIANRINMRNLGLIIVIGLQHAALIRAEAGLIQIEAFGIAHTPGRIERLFRIDALAALQIDAHPLTGTVLVCFHVRHGFTEPERQAVLPHVIDQRVDQFIVDERQQTLALVDQGDAHTERGENGRIFAVDHTGADDGDRGG